MDSTAFKKALIEDLPVLFVNIGWAIRYDGTETIVANHKYVREHPDSRVSEVAAFHARRGYFRCGLGGGLTVPPRLHVVFVSTDPSSQTLKLVGLYAASEVIETDEGVWVEVRTKWAKRIEVTRRCEIAEWPKGQGMRRWARREGPGRVHPGLHKFFERLRKSILGGKELPSVATAAADNSIGHEGGPEERYTKSRKRDRVLRRKKILQAMHGKGGLTCEVPRCRFNFEKTYGELGVGFAEVHHKFPLFHSPKKGREVRLSDLAIVCANCHRMIHRSGMFKSWEKLIPV